MTTWGEWRDSYPETEVLVPPPESDTVTGRGRRNYNTNPYSDYENSQPPDLSVGEDDERVPPRALVLGVATDDAARAYPFKAVLDSGSVVNDRVGDDAIQFGRDGDALVGGGSRWAVVSGRARDGPHEGTDLDRANDHSPMFWFAWLDFFPGTEVYGEA